MEIHPRIKSGQKRVENMSSEKGTSIPLGWGQLNGIEQTNPFPSGKVQNNDVAASEEAASGKAALNGAADSAALSKEYLAWLGNQFKQNYVLLQRVARYHLGWSTDNVTEADDVVQDVFIIAASKDIRKEANPVGWLVRATINTCRNHNSANQRITAKEDKSADALRRNQPMRYGRLVDGAQDDETEASSINLTLQQELSADDYRLFQEYFVRGTKLSDLSKRDGRSDNAMRVKIFRLRKKIEKIFMPAVIFLVIRNIY